MGTVVAIDIGSKNLHLVEGSFQRGQLSIKKTQTYELPQGAVAGDAVANEDMLAGAISSALAVSGIQTKSAVLTVNAADAVVRELELPPAKPKELSKMIEHEMSQSFHTLATDIIQYRSIGKMIGPDGAELMRYRVAAMDQGVVESYLQALENARLRPLAMDINVNAVDKFFSWAGSINNRPVGEDAVMLVDIGHTSMTVYIFAKEQPMFYRHLSFGSGEIDSLIAAAIPQSSERAKATKEKENLFGEDGLYAEVLQPYFYRINDDLRRIVTFFNNRSRTIKVGSAYLFGQGSGLPGLAEYWAGQLVLPVEIIHAAGKVLATEREIQPAHVNAIGAIIRY